MQSLQAVAAQAKEQAESDDDSPEIPEPTGTLPKPNFQHLHAKHIEWVWNPVIGKCSVTATYSRTSQTYLVDSNCDLSNGPLTGGEAKAYGEALISAWQWEYTWQQHAGEFLTTAEESDDEDEPDLS